MANNIFAELLTWSKELTPWQNEAIRRLFRQGNLSNHDMDELFELAKVDYGIVPLSSPIVDLMLKATDIPTAPVSGQKIQLKSVRNLENVNLLESNTRLLIGDHLTVIYGENASGKSGYARVMKKAFRARAVEEILPNVYIPIGTSKGSAKAIFEIEENGVLGDKVWVDGSRSPECLGRFAVCDSKCARVYISQDNELDFLPYGFDILLGLGKATEEIKKRFQSVATASLPNKEILGPFIDNTTVGKFINILSASTTESEVKKLAIWIEDDIKALKNKEEELEKLKTSSPTTLRNALAIRIKQLQAVKASIEPLVHAVSDSKVGTLKTKVLEFVQYEKAVEIAAKLAFEKMPLPGIGGEVWRKLLLSAAEFSNQHAYLGQQFPVDVPAAKCVLCLQDLDKVAQDRLKRFWDFIQDDTSSKRDKAKATLDFEINSLKKIPTDLPKEVIILEDALRSAGSKVFDEVKPYMEKIAIRVKNIETAVKMNDWELMSAAPESPIKVIDAEITTLQESFAEIVDDGKVQDRIRSFSDEIAEYKARQRINANLKLILDYLKNLKDSSLANQVAAKVTTHAISIKASNLQTQFVTEEFKKGIKDELEPMGLDRVKTNIEKKSDKGKVLHKVVIEGGIKAPLEAVFSEGERTAIALACFLAELRTSADNCGIIFDDPVSSLDHKIRDKVVDRLVYEAKQRQVVVFTHDLVFFTELLESAQCQAVPYFIQNLVALGIHVGLISALPQEALNVKQRLQELDKLMLKVREAEKAADVPNYVQGEGDFYQLLRSTWERCVEECLFNGVVQRLQKEVKTLKLDGVSVDNSSVAMIFDGMTRTSSMIKAHDRAVAKNTPLASLADMEKDLGDLKTFLAKQQLKKQDAEKQNAHLKSNFLSKLNVLK